MEAWTESRDDDDDAGNDKGKCGFAFDLDFELEKYRFDSSKERLRSLFDQVLVAFMREKSACKCVRPIPAFCGDGRPVDLFKLFWVVRKIGGHETVSRNNLWGFVSEECGLGFGVIPSIKLIYMKYLDELDRWLQQAFRENSLEDGHSQLIQKLDLFSWKLETKFRGLQEKDSNFVKDTKDRADIPLDIGKGKLHLSKNGEISGPVEDEINFLTEEDEKFCSGNGIICEVHGVHRCIMGDFAASAKRVRKKSVNEANGFSKGQSNEKVVQNVFNHGETIAADADGDVERFSIQDKNDVCTSTKEIVKKAISETHDLSDNIADDEERFGVQEGIHMMIPARSGLGDVLDSRKRKRQSQSFSGMLNWLIHVAKHSDDPSVGSIPECSKWRDYGNEEFWVQALFVREAFRRRRQADTNSGESLMKDQQKKPRMHPSMYGDDVHDHQHTEKLRCSKRISSLTKATLCPCCKNSSAPPQSKATICPDSEVVNNLKSPQKIVVANVEEPVTNSNDKKSCDVPFQKQVSVGPLSQAEVPQWTGVISESDPKWLGTRMWAPEDSEKISTAQLDPIGKGRQHYPCDCPFPNSVECVRFHIAEKRFKLKQELGSLFYCWRFHRMGEEVSLSWTEEEEKTFKDMMRSHGALSKKFFKVASTLLPSKTRENLVSYYFNVFVEQRRRYQNRVTPKEVDSDDDEKECGSIGDSFGYKALYVPGLKLISCALNQESTEMV